MCSSSSRIKSSMASRSWVADKAITILKNTPNVGAKQLQKQLQDDYKVTIGYDTVWQGREIAVNNLYGNWEESFQRLYNFKAEVELRSPGSIVEIDTINVRGNVHFNRFFCAFRPCIEGFVVGCRPYISIDSTALNGKWNGQLCAVTALDGSEQDRHVVKTHIHECTCLEWQHTGKPCPHALAFLTTQKNVNMEDYVHEYYSLQKFRAAYEGAIEPMTGKAQWPRVELGFTVLPPIAKRSAGRRRKQRIKNCFEKGVKVKRLQNKNKCKRCGELGHRQAGCPLNGTKKRKRKSRTDTRSEASSRGKGKETPSTPIKSTINIPSSLSGSPGPITRRQLALAMADGPSQVVLPTSPQRARTSPAKAKKITPKKKKN